MCVCVCMTNKRHKKPDYFPLVPRLLLQPSLLTCSWTPLVRGGRLVAAGKAAEGGAGAGAGAGAPYWEGDEKE